MKKNITKPETKPANANFSSGPCTKYPGYSYDDLKDAPLGRSHRSAEGKAKLKESIEKTKSFLEIPPDYLIGIVPGSDTGAFEMAMWNLLGPRGVDVLSFEAFGKGWANDISKELKLKKVNIINAGYGFLPNLDAVNPENDLVFPWNGTTSGVKIPAADFIAKDRKGITLCDATSAVFAMELPWDKLDATTFSWQKVLGGEAAHGMLILSPRAVERINSYNPPWPIPKIFQLKKNGAILKEIFEGSTINTPSMLCNEDYLAALRWASAKGGLKKLIRLSENNLKVIEDYVANRDWLDFLAAKQEYRSNTSVCLKTALEPDDLDKIVKLMADEGAAYDIAAYRDAPAGLRFWCGATVEKENLEIMLKWLDWAYEVITGNKN